MMPNLIYKDYTDMGEDISKLKYLFEHIFPREERPPFKNFIKFKQQIIGVYDNNTFIGFIVLAFFNDLLYIHFLAIKKRYHRHGYGSKILQDVFTKYDKDYRIYLFMEELDKKYQNYLERKNRANFYLKNGFHITNIKIDEFEVIYTLLTNNKKVTYLDHISLMNHILPNDIAKLYLKNCKEYLS